MVVYEVRHGLYASRSGELTETGKVQAEQAAQFIGQATAGQRVRVICSPLLRTKQTALVIAGALGVEPQVADWLDEREFSYPTFEAYVGQSVSFGTCDALVIVHHEANIKLVATLRAQARFEEEVLPGTVVEVDWVARAVKVVHQYARPAVVPA